MNKIIRLQSAKLTAATAGAVVGVAVLSVLLASSCSAPGSPDATLANVEAGSPGVVWLATVEGMSCALNCAPKVAAALESIEGVHGASVDFETQTAVITAAAGLELTADMCDRSFDNQDNPEGYFISELKRKRPAEKL